VRLWTAARDIIVSGKCCLYMKKLFVLSSSFYHHFEAVTELEKPKAALFSGLVASLKTWSWSNQRWGLWWSYGCIRLQRTKMDPRSKYDLLAGKVSLLGISPRPIVCWCRTGNHWWL